jgi:hypothetical protein
VPEPIAVLTLGAEGGRIRLLASGPAGHCTYRLEIRDGTAALLNEEDRAGPTSRTPAPAGGWDAALAMLDRECPHWVKFSPLAVHPDFVTRLRAAVEERCEGRTLDRWRAFFEPAS